MGLQLPCLVSRVSPNSPFARLQSLGFPFNMSAVTLNRHFAFSPENLSQGRYYTLVTNLFHHVGKFYEFVTISFTCAALSTLTSYKRSNQIKRLFSFGKTVCTGFKFVVLGVALYGDQFLTFLNSSYKIIFCYNILLLLRTFLSVLLPCLALTNECFSRPHLNGRRMIIVLGSSKRDMSPAFSLHANGYIWPQRWDQLTARIILPSCKCPLRQN